jgi:broad specificity phosphatase PhoE
VQGRGFLDQPDRQSVLSDKGKQQAQLTGEALASLDFDVVYCSPLVRAKQTAEIITTAAGCTQQPEAVMNLCEIDLPAWEEMTYAEVKAQYPREYELWHHAPHQLSMLGKYPVKDLFAQAQLLWQEVLSRHQGQTILLVGHSGINRSLISTALGLDPAYYHYWQQTNCGISVLNFSGDLSAEYLQKCFHGAARLPIQLESVNITSHLLPLNHSALTPYKKEHVGPRILLVRHGETNWNRDKRFQGQIDIPLNERGEEQARLVANFLASERIDLAFSSPLARPKQTAEAILNSHNQIPMTLIDDLQEISHGQWEGKLESEIEADFPGELQRWKDTPQSVQMPDGENLQQVWQRSAAAWQQIVDSTPAGKVALVSAHDAVNKALLCDLFDLPPDYFWAFKQGNGGVSVIDYPGGSSSHPTLMSLNITTHLSDSILDKTAAGAL